MAEKCHKRSVSSKIHTNPNRENMTNFQDDKT